MAFFPIQSPTINIIISITLTFLSTPATSKANCEGKTQFLKTRLRVKSARSKLRASKSKLTNDRVTKFHNQNNDQNKNCENETNTEDTKTPSLAKAAEQHLNSEHISDCCVCVLWGIHQHICITLLSKISSSTNVTIEWS